MQTLNIAPPDSLVCTEQELETFVREGLSGKGEPVSPEYWQRIRREVQKRLDQDENQELEQFVREGLGSGKGEPIPFTLDIWTGIDANVQQRLERASGIGRFV